MGVNNNLPFVLLKNSCHCILFLIGQRKYHCIEFSINYVTVEVLEIVFLKCVTGYEAPLRIENIQ